MQLVLDDLICPACAGYVHPFLDRCPACGGQRESRYGDAAATGDLGAGALVESDGIRSAVRSVVLRYSLKAMGGPVEDHLADGLAVVAGSLTYRAAVVADGPTSSLPAGATVADTAAVGVDAGAITVVARPAGRTIARIPLAAVVAVTPIVRRLPDAGAWVGPSLGDRRLLEARPLAGDLLITFATPEAAGQVALENRRGLLATRARSDHYVLLARWIGMLAAAAAEARWTSAGAAAHAVELGLGSRETLRSAAGDAAPSAGGGPSTVPSVRVALEELEGLRSAGLITDAEYAAKRAQILARL